MNLKNSLNSFRALSSAILFLITVTTLISCGPATSQNGLDEIPEFPEIWLRIGEGFDVLRAEGAGLSSNWDYDLGIVSINMDEELNGKLDRYGSLILVLTEVPDNPNTTSIVPIDRVYISITSCLIDCLSEELNAKFYTLDTSKYYSECNALYRPSITGSYIQANDLCMMVVDSDDDTVYKLEGSFTAINENPYQ